MILSDNDDSSSECGLTDDIVQQHDLTLSSSSAGLSKPTFDSLPPTLVSRDLTQDTSHSDSHSQDLLVQDTTYNPFLSVIGTCPTSKLWLNS